MKAGLRGHALEDMEVAVGETLSNVHRHAYEVGIGPVAIAVFRHPDAVSVFVSDRGNAIVAPDDPRDMRQRSGLYLAGRLADEVRMRVSRTGHGLVVRLMKRLSP